jgi:hypothetical protein
LIDFGVEDLNRGGARDGKDAPVRDIGRVLGPGGDAMTEDEAGGGAYLQAQTGRREEGEV